MISNTQLSSDDTSLDSLSNKVYVIVRRDLPWPVRTVQAIHAAMQLIRGMRKTNFDSYPIPQSNEVLMLDGHESNVFAESLIIPSGPNRALREAAVRHQQITSEPWGQHGPPVVLLGVENESALDTWRVRFIERSANMQAFYEPDMNNSLTSLAYYGQSFNELAGLRLM